MIAKFKLEDVFNVSGKIVLCGPIMEGEITPESVVILDGVKIPIHGIEMFRKFLKKASKGDNVGIFLKTNVGANGKSIYNKFRFSTTNQLIDIVDVTELRIEKLEELGI